MSSAFIRALALQAGHAEHDPQPEPCTRPPKGWYCLRGVHDGPCAAWPTRWTRLKLWLTHPGRGPALLHVPRSPKPHPNCRCQPLSADLPLGVVKVRKP